MPGFQTDISIEIEGAEELQNDLERLVGEYRSDVIKGMKDCAKEFKKDVNAKYPSDYKKGKRPIPKEWKIEEVRSSLTGTTQEINVRNTAPHFHLIENGHESYIPIRFGVGKHVERRKRKSYKKPKNKSHLKYNGFTAGGHQCKTTRDEWNSGKYVKNMTVVVDNILKEHNL